jgi:CheY-like chemotaxis protein
LTASLRKDFVSSLPATLTGLRSHVQVLNRSADERERSRTLEAMYHVMHAVTNNAGITGLVQIGQFSEAVEALLKELFEKPRQFTPSTMRTVAHAVDFLGVLFAHYEVTQAWPGTALNIMVVDDEPLSRRAVLYALEKARLKATHFDNPHNALQALSNGSFDLVFLDVDMPGMNGFELCTRLRALPQYKHTPVVFVTTLNDFESRAQSTISGGNDLIAKPFLFVELAVKALVYVLRSRINQAKQTGTAQPAAS